LTSTGDEARQVVIAEARTPGEARFEAARRRIGKVLGPLCLLRVAGGAVAGPRPGRRTRWRRSRR
jgi:hypothetical protein